MSEEGCLSVIILMKAGLFFSVERQILLLYQGGLVKWDEIGKWTKASKKMILECAF